MAVNQLKIQNILWFGKTDIVREALSLPETVVKDNKQRRVTALGEPTPRFYLKKDKTHGFRNRFKRLFRDRIQAEFKTGLRLEKAGIPVVKHVAWGKKGVHSYLLTQAFPGEQLIAFWRRIKGNRPAENELITVLTGVLKVFFEQSFYHPDLHGGNLLVDSSGSKPSLCFVDVYGIRQQRLSGADLITMLVFVFNLTEHWPEADQEKVFAEFLDFFPGLSVSELVTKVSKAFVNRLHKWRRTRMSKYLKSSSACVGWDMNQGQVISRREIGRELTKKIFAVYADEKGEGDRPGISHIETDGKRYVINQFDGGRFPGRQNWLNGISLEIMGVPAVKNLAWLRGEKNDWILMEDAEGENLADYLIGDAPVKAKLGHLGAAARLVLRMRRRGIVFPDLNLSYFTLKRDHELLISHHDSIQIKPPSPQGPPHDPSIDLFLDHVCQFSEKHGLPLPADLSLDKLSRLVEHDCVIGDPEEIVHWDWSEEWHHDLP